MHGLMERNDSDLVFQSEFKSQNSDDARVQYHDSDMSHNLQMNISEYIGIYRDKK